jgi:hypothetical protein
MSNNIQILSAAALLATVAHAQCLGLAAGTPVTLTPTTTFPVDDEGISAALPLGFAFPIAGAAAATFDHIAIESNGAIYLCDSTGPVGTTTFGLQDMAGIAGDSPRIACYWADLEGVAPTWGITLDTTVPGRAAVRWTDVNEYFQPGTFTVEVELFATGHVHMTYSAAMQVQLFQATTGVSPGNGLVGSSVVLATLPASANTSLYEEHPNGVFQLSDQTIGFLPAGAGLVTVRLCGAPLARHDAYGAGCYDIAGSLYEYFADAAVASAALTGQSMQFVPATASYVAIWGGASYVTPPATAQVLATLDDGEVSVTPSAPLSTPFGPETTLFVHGNGLITLGAPQAFVGASWAPDPQEFLDAGTTAFWSWHDFNAAEVGSGDVKYHEAAGVAYVTYDDVENYPGGTVNRSTVQFQLTLATGLVAIVWQSVDSDITSTFGSDHLVGYSAGGPSIDGGSVTLSTALPLTVRGTDISALALSAAPVAISTATSGTTVVFTTDNMQPLPGGGVFAGLHIISLGQVPAPGLDLGFLGAPGCAALVQSIDFAQAMVGVTSSLSVSLTIPPGIAPGTLLYSQSANLFAPNSLPNGQNAFGLLTSNGIATLISSQ